MWVRRSVVNGPGLRRVRRGKGFSYYGPDRRRDGAAAVEVSRFWGRSSHNEVMITAIPTRGYVDS